MTKAFHAFLNVTIAILGAALLWFCWTAFDMARWAIFRIVYDVTSVLAVVGAALVIYAWRKLRSKD